MPIDINIRSDLSNAFFGPTESQYRLARAGSRRGNNVAQSIDQYLRQQSSITQFAFPGDRPRFYTQILLEEYSRKDLFNVGTMNAYGAVYLPLPQQMVDRHGVTYSEDALGIGLGTGINTFLNTNAQASASDIRGQITEQGLNNAGQAAAAGLGAAVAATVVPQGVQNAAQTFAGFSPNEFFTIIMKGPQYKRHSLQWELSPRNALESNKIKEIIRLFNNQMSPGLAAGGALFSFPSLFKIAFMPNYRYLYRFKPAVLESMDVNYTPNPTPVFYHNSGNGPDEWPPERVQIQLNFLEMEYWLSSDFLADGGAYDTRGNARYDNYLQRNWQEAYSEFNKFVGQTYEQLKDKLADPNPGQIK
jgi:hypothetical protein